MPEFSILRSAVRLRRRRRAPKQLNPFKRVTEKPVVFWSGIVDADATEREVIYDVPDYFSGTLTVMAVAVARRCDRRGGTRSAHPRSVRHHAERADLAAPGDEFEVGRDRREQRRRLRRKRGGADPGRDRLSICRS